jgi:hypothetical protein
VIAVLNGKARKKDMEKIKEGMSKETGGRLQFFDKPGAQASARAGMIGAGKFARPKQPAAEKAVVVSARADESDTTMLAPSAPKFKVVTDETVTHDNGKI